MPGEPNGGRADAESNRRAMLEALRAESESTARFDWIGQPNLEPLARELVDYDRHVTIATVAGLLTVPAYQTSTLRLELLLHLAACHCRGTRRIAKRALVRWVNETLGGLPIRHMEDPTEDVFVSNVIAGGGNYRLFEGTWEGNDFHLQLLLDVLYFAPEWRDSWRLRARIEGLLTLSDAMAERSALARWATTTVEGPRTDILRRLPELEDLRRRVTFTEDELHQLGVPSAAIAPFMADPAVSRDLQAESVRQNALLRRPLVRFGREIVVALPAAISVAARHAILEEAASTGRLAALQQDFDEHQRSFLFGRLMSRLDIPAGYKPPLQVVPPSDVRVARSVAGVAFVPFDLDKIAHVVLMTDHLDDVHRAGIAADVEFAETEEAELGAYLAAGARLIREAGASGMTLLVIGGLGRGMYLSLPRGADGLPDGWPTLSFSLGDLETFATSEGASLLRLWKLESQEAVARSVGVAVANANGSLNLYAFWARQDFELVADEVPVPQAHGLLMIQSDFLYELRVAIRRLTDVHAAPLGRGGAQMRVRRLHERPFFASASHRPIFIADELLAAGELAGVVESELIVVWVFAGSAKSPAVRETSYRTWDAILSWLDRLIPFLRGVVSEQLERVRGKRARPTGHSPQFVRRFRLRLEEEEGWASESIPAVPRPAARPWVAPAADVGDAEQTIHVPAGFQALLNQPANAGERALLEEIGIDIVSSCVDSVVDSNPANREVLRADVVQAVASCMRGPDAREMHVWHTTHPLGTIDASDLADPRFVQPEDEAAWQFGLGTRLGVTPVDQSQPADKAREEPGAAVAITGSAESVGFLHDVVDRLWEDLRTRLQVVSGPALVEMLTRNTEAVFKDRTHWRRTARAIAAIHDSEDVPAISLRRESERAITSTASRVVIEMALCTSPVSGGKPPSLADMDWLLAGVALLLEAAADADAIRGGLVAPHVTIAANGRVRTERERLQQLLHRFGRDSHADEFRAAAAAYDDLFRRRAEGGERADLAEKRDANKLSTIEGQFEQAYAAEFGIAFDRIIDAFAELLDLGAELGRVVVTTRGAVAERLRAKRQYSAPELDAFFAALALEPRPRWDEAPSGFGKRDWEPWRFRRRLSVSARPLIVFGSASDAPCIFGAAQLGASLSYVSEGIRSGWFPTEYFRSVEMRQYRGAITKELSLAFEIEVASKCSGAGWNAKHSVQMSTLGAPAGLRLGEIDVIAWRPGHPVLWLIECKRLQPTRTISEIVERLRQFRGDSNDLLSKHLRRLEWVRANLEAVRAKLGIGHDVGQAHAVLVANARMPMQYAEGLPLPTEHIVSEGDLLEVLESRPA